MIGSQPRRLEELNYKLKALHLPKARLHTDREQTELEQIADANIRRYYEDLEVSVYEILTALGE